MSLVLSKDDILFSQRFLKAAGYYKGRLDGIWGSKTDTATEVFEKRTAEIAQMYGIFDSRSEREIATLQPVAQIAARLFLERLEIADINARIISGTRTYLEQERLYQKGRFGNKGPKVTNARGGRSNHNFGIAWDIGIFKNGRYQGESPLYNTAGPIGVADNVEWGGNWKTFKDRPHYQLKTGLTIAEVRKRFESGKQYWQ
jgi:peptidoglycan L-alanyl-D-glutamate endopeptidase CwlK